MDAGGTKQDWVAAYLSQLATQRQLSPLTADSYAGESGGITRS